MCLKQFSLVNEKFSYKKGMSFYIILPGELDHILPGAKAFRFGNVEFAVLLPYATEEESTGSLKRGYRNALRNDGNWEPWEAISRPISPT